MYAYIIKVLNFPFSTVTSVVSKELLLPFARCRTHESRPCPSPCHHSRDDPPGGGEGEPVQCCDVGELSPLFFCYVAARAGETCVGVSSPFHPPSPETGRIAAPEIIKAELSLAIMNRGVAPTPTLGNTVELVLYV